MCTLPNPDFHKPIKKFIESHNVFRERQTGIPLNDGAVLLLFLMLLLLLLLATIITTTTKIVSNEFIERFLYF